MTPKQCVVQPFGSLVRLFIHRFSMRIFVPSASEMAHCEKVIFFIFRGLISKLAWERWKRT